MRRRPEISGKLVLADLRRLPEHPVGLGRISGLERDRQICRSNEESGSAGPSIKGKAGSTGRPPACWAGGAKSLGGRSVARARNQEGPQGRPRRDVPGAQDSRRVASRTVPLPPDQATV